MTKPSNREFAVIFNTSALKYDGISNAYAVSRRRDFFVLQAKGDCLEVGAGTGEMSRELMKSHHVVATDISAGMVDEIKKKFNIEAIVCDAEHLPFPGGSFDTVIGAEMIYYLDHPESFLREAFRVLRPGGRLLLSSANNTTKIYDRIRALFRKLGFRQMYFDDKIREFMTLSRLRGIIESAGFKISNEQKIIPLPFAFLDKINKVLERTPFKNLGIFILVRAEKL